MNVPHPIPYQGSKRWMAPTILSYFPKEVYRLVEPFAGSAAVSLAAASQNKAKGFWLNDLNAPLMRLWEEIITRPNELISAYEHLWEEQQGREKEYYNLIRDKFNRTNRPDYFLYLLARCVKASIRYNPEGYFNQSPDNRRKGALPSDMRKRVLGASLLLQERTILTTMDYKKVLSSIDSSDLIYMDPPYRGVCGNKDRRYLKAVFLDEFVDTLVELNRKKYSYIVSYDGKTGDRTYGEYLPDYLKLIRIEVDAGRSTQATLLGRNDRTTESLYLSPTLADRLQESIVPVPQIRQPQLALF